MEEKMRLAFIGDIGFVGRYEIRKGEAEQRLKDLKTELLKYDYVIGNLETPLTERAFSFKCKTWHLHAASRNVQLLKYLGIDAVSLANNHIYDFGRKGVEDTIDCLDQMGITWFGIDGKEHHINNLSEKVSLSGFNCFSTCGNNYISTFGKKGVNLLCYSNMIEQKKRDHRSGYLTFMFVHWGQEFTHYPEPYHVCLARELMNMQDIAIIGSHPHYIQGIEEYNEKNALCAYSLGNGIYDEVNSLNKKMKVPFTEENKRMILLGIDVIDGKMHISQKEGWYHDVDRLVMRDLSEEIEHYSHVVKTVVSWDDYNEKRQREVEGYLEKLNIKRDLNWLVNRLNYNMIGSKIYKDYIKKKYKMEVEAFMKNTRSVRQWGAL